MTGRLVFATGLPVLAEIECVLRLEVRGAEGVDRGRAGARWPSTAAAGR